jgi:hypothetical protein
VSVVQHVSCLKQLRGVPQSQLARHGPTAVHTQTYTNAQLGRQPARALPARLSDTTLTRNMVVEPMQHMSPDKPTPLRTRHNAPDR